EAPAVMRDRDEAVQRQVRENGVTYNVYSDAKGMQRPWDLNVMPLILPAQEWAGIEAAVCQRATLLNQILLDVYADQTLLQQGLLPPALIHGNSGFLRPCHGIRHLDGIALHFYAVDLARAPSGRWWVVSDRTQAPSGAGYALENRAVIARNFPDMLRDLNVQPLSGFFETMRDSLNRWGHQVSTSGGVPLRPGEPPLIVLLTPGPHNETYYEQAYLARHLGLPLVEGSDLTVRNGLVWHKALSGLQRVHVILRRVDDDYCDPLELRSDSALGVAGLTEASRRGNVLVANSLGSNLLESGALLGYLPALAERMLGARLKMPSVATWWCGEPAALEQVIAKLDRLVIKPSFKQGGQFTVFGRDLAGAARTAFIAKMRARPANYVAQELVHLSQVPVWRRDAPIGLSGSAMGLRVFACATPDGFVVLPGGLARVATGPDTRIIAMQRGGGSQDTWVQARADVPVEAHKPLTRTTTSADLIRDDTHVSSRAAENLFWFGRNSERSDNTARLTRVSLNFLCNARPPAHLVAWSTVKSLCEHFHLFDGRDPVPAEEAKPLPASAVATPAALAVRPPSATAAVLSAGPAVVASQMQMQTVTPAQTSPLAPTPSPALAQTQTQVPGRVRPLVEPAASATAAAAVAAIAPAAPPAQLVLSDAQIKAALLLSVVCAEVPGLARQQQQLFQSASQLRERLSLDNWRALNRLVQPHSGGDSRLLTQAEAMELLDDAAASAMTIAGFALDGMTRDLGWRFLSLGRRLERLQYLCTLLQNALAMDINGDLDWLLELADSIVTYRARYRAQPEWLPVLDLLILDDSNPRSVLFQLDGILNGLQKMAMNEHDLGSQGLKACQAEFLALAPETHLFGGNARLIELLGRTRHASEAMSEQISVQFFSYTGERGAVR
ncbi:MAG: circularly permuted type 2 ATP-grasp protein, partial [Polaromonas sp.]|nr:circularly permuted type 2 ATP-grasp protein [Polaromonas sp.]